MSNEIINITTKLCVNGRCDDVNLNLSQAEAFKIYQLASSSKVETVDYSHYMQFWAVSFSATLSLWFVSFVIGRILRFFR